MASAIPPLFYNHHIMIRKIIFTLFVAGLLVACQTGQKKETPDLEGFEKLPLQSQITRVQPMTGIVIFANNPQCQTDAISLEYSYLLYKDVVKEKGVYDWSSFESLLDTIASHGHQAIIRLRYVYPGDKESAVPQYIRDLPGYEETIGKSEGKETCFPDWRNEELQRFHKEFYQKFAERYDRDPRIAFLQTGFGLWAEYHIYDGPRIIGRTFPSKKFQAEFFKLMEETFTYTPWMISIDAADPAYTPFAEEPELKELKFGVFDDSFMHETHADHNGKNWTFFGEDRYRESPAGGEFSYYTKYDQEHVLDYPEGIYGHTFEEEAARFHITFMKGNGQLAYQTMERLEQAGMACGYRYVITDAWTKEDYTWVQIENAGVAPIYRDAYVAVNGVRSESSLIDLQPGESRWVGISAGGGGSVVSIECDHLIAGQRIEFEADVKAD